MKNKKFNSSKTGFNLHGVFIGQNSSMSFQKDKRYQFVTYIENGFLKLQTTCGRYCHYSNMEALLENWEIIDE